ncbi:MAG: DnaJ domain-containing protein [Pseudomonadota bacterium]
MNREDIYRLLGISQKAPAESVKKAFKNFAKHNHPDFFPDDPLREERFKKVTSAYQSWKLIQNTINEITRLKTASIRYSATGFKPWSFSCKA